MVIGKLFERPTIETDFTPNNFGNGARTQESAIGKLIAQFLYKLKFSNQYNYAITRGNSRWYRKLQ
ncbi:MAG TPA: hypothetical protein VLA84_19270 [Microcoleus sp.]|nr:hypothetical protein [Microcoleus sp.]